MIALPASPSVVLEQAINPELEQLPPAMHTNMARIALLAIAIHESALAHREQVGGPARSFWQFEMGGIISVLEHPSVGSIAAHACGRHGVLPSGRLVYQAFLEDDGLAAAFARCLLWADPYTLATDAEGVFSAYLRQWRPGDFMRGDSDRRKAIRERWGRAFKLAEDTVL